MNDNSMEGMFYSPAELAWQLANYKEEEEEQPKKNAWDDIQHVMWEKATRDGKTVWRHKYTGEIQTLNPEKINIVHEAPKWSDVNITCSHILLKHKGSHNPSSPRNPHITISKMEALAKIIKIRKKILAGKSFQEMAYKYSDCPSFEKGGDLGSFHGGEMDTEFENVAFELDVGELSNPVITIHGVHIILRTE